MRPLGAPPADGALVRYRAGDGAAWGVVRDGRVAALDCGLADLLLLEREAARAVVERAPAGRLPLAELELLAPIDRQEVWAAGVTYERSRDGRVEESGKFDLYDGVYRGERPELFFKATPDRVVAPGGEVGIRFDSVWDVPEPEVGVVYDPRFGVFGFTVGNDVSSRSIEGENPLYLPQAKIYDRACSLGPWITPSWAVGPEPFTIELTIERDGGTLFREQTSTARLRRTYEALGGWIGRAMSFPHGVVLLTGTGIVPDAGLSLRDGDLVTVDVSQLGTLRNAVVTVGAPAAGERAETSTGATGTVAS